MIDQLIILNRCNNYLGEGFFKFENGYGNMTVAFKETHKRTYYWYCDFNYGMFKDKTIAKTNSPIKSKPNNCGIFYKKDNRAYPILYYGDIDIVCGEFEQISRIETLPVAMETTYEKEEKEIKEDNKFEKETDNITNIENESIQTKSNDDYSAEENKIIVTQVDNIPESFWDVNEKEIEKLLNTLPEEDNMASLIPGSKWVKAEDYLLGVIYDEFSSPLYICYGFDMPWSDNPPKKLKGYSQWIPRDCAKPHDKGYWVIYINAKTGERVK